MKNQWETIIGNIGTIYSGTNGFQAIKEYNQGIRLSKGNCSRASGEPVTLLKNGEIYKEYLGTLTQED